MLVVVDRQELPALSKQLTEAIRRAYVARGLPAPYLLLSLADELARSARGPAGPPEHAGRGQVADQPGASGRVVAARCNQPVLTIRDAARRAQVSEGHMRRVLRRGLVEASRDNWSSRWLVDTDSLAAFIASRNRAAN